MLLQIGVSDPALQRELGSIKNPTLLAFSNKLEGYKQVRKTVAQSTFGLAAKGNQPRCNPLPLLPSLISDPIPYAGVVKGTEASLCGENVFFVQGRILCFLNAHIQLWCNTVGHISPVCIKCQTASSVQQPS